MVLKFYKSKWNSPILYVKISFRVEIPSQQIKVIKNSSSKSFFFFPIELHDSFVKRLYHGRGPLDISFAQVMHACSCKS